MNGIVKAYFAVCGTVCAVRLLRSYGRRKEKDGYNRGFDDAVAYQCNITRQKRDYDNEKKVIFN